MRQRRYTVNLLDPNSRQKAAEFDGIVVAAGHKLTTSWRGCQSGYAHGTCECGWVYPGWSERMNAVRDSHQRHIDRVIREPNDKRHW